MKKFLLTALLLAFALTGVVTTEGTDDTTTGENTTPTTEEGTTTTEGEEEDYGVMPTDVLCEPWDCWGA